jgi:hypothetical protein
MVAITDHFAKRDVYDFFLKISGPGEFGVDPSADRFFFMPRNNNFTHLAGIDYFLSDLPIFADPFRLIGRRGHYYVYRNEQAFPRFYFVDHATVVDPKESILDRIATMDTAMLRRTALIRRGEGLDDDVSFEPGGRDVKLVSYGPNRITFATGSSQPQLLVLNDTFDPRWRATIDGHAARSMRVNAIFRGVWVPAGSHRVEYSYEYKAFFYYWGIAAATLTMVGLTGAYELCGRRGAGSASGNRPQMLGSSLDEAKRGV